MADRNSPPNKEPQAAQCGDQQAHRKEDEHNLCERFNAAGGPRGPIYSIDQMFADAQVEYLKMAQDVPNPKGRHIRLVGQPVTPSRTPSRMMVRPPEFGEQAEFGFTADEIGQL
jgi:formyl-CoA transferase